MKKKIFCISVIFIMLVNVVFILTGCESKKEIKEVEEIVENVEQNTQVVDETLVKINGLEFHMNKETSYKDVKYTIVEEFKESNFGRYIQYNYYPENSTNLLYFRIFYYANQGNDMAIKDLGLNSNIALTDGKTDNIEYKCYVEPRQDGGTMNCYFVNKNGNTYVFSFISKYDIKELEEKVIKSIKF